MRVFRDLKTFTSHIRNFRSLRNVTDSLAESWGPPGQGSASADPHETSRRTSFIHSGTVRGESGVQSAPSGCIPFLGLFLRDLAISSELPTFLDATSPTTPASMDPVSNQLDVVADPQAFSDLPPIPDQYQHYPLVNVHKARTISSIVQKVLVFQEMATCYPYEADAVLFRKCLALRCLSVEGQRSHSFQLEG